MKTLQDKLQHANKVADLDDTFLYEMMELSLQYEYSLDDMWQDVMDTLTGLGYI